MKNSMHYLSPPVCLSCQTPVFCFSDFLRLNTYSSSLFSSMHNDTVATPCRVKLGSICTFSSSSPYLLFASHLDRHHSETIYILLDDFYWQVQRKTANLPWLHMEVAPAIGWDMDLQMMQPIIDVLFIKIFNLYAHYSSINWQLLIFIKMFNLYIYSIFIKSLRLASLLADKWDQPYI